MSDNNALIVIPARMASTRFPDKPLAVISGMSMIERVWRLAKAVKSASHVVIATDSELLSEFAENLGADVVMTSSDCLTGTDRVAETSKILGDQYNVIFSFQGDAVLTPPWVIDGVLKEMIKDPSIFMATPAVRLTGNALTDFIASKKKGSSSGTCVVFDKNKNAMYFSKALIPYSRSNDSANLPVFRHIGLYGYRKETLQKLSELPEGMFEKVEKLEQLRALENGIPIRIVEVDYKGRTHGSVDSPNDVTFVESIIAQEGELL